MLSSGAGHVPALSGPLSILPSSQGSGCPSLPPARGDELEAVSFHHRTSVGASGRSRSIWRPDRTQLRRSDRLGSPMHEYKPAGPCHGRGFRHPRGLSDRRPRAGSGEGRPCCPTVAFSHDDNGRAASGSSDQDRCSTRDAVQGDEGASPVLVAVVNEFAKKAGKAALSADERVAVIELEQAGDSAKAAVEADPGRVTGYTGRSPRGSFGDLRSEGQARSLTLRMEGQTRGVSRRSGPAVEIRATGGPGCP